MEDLYYSIKRDDPSYLRCELENEMSPDSKLIFSNPTNPNIDKLLISQPPLVSVAAYFKAYKCLSLLLDKKASPNIQDQIGMSCMEFAIIGNDIHCVDLLIKHEADTSHFLEYAVKYNSLSMLQFGLESKFPNESQALAYSIELKNINTLELLLRAGTTFSDEYLNCDAQISSLLQLYSAQMVKSHPEIYDNPLIISCFEGDYQRVKSIIEGGQFDINSVNENGDTPLMCASHRGATNIISLLLSVPNIELNKQNKGGKTALYIACQRLKLQAVKLLLNSGCDPTIRTSHGRTILHAISKKGKLELVDTILSIPYLHPNQQDDKGDTSLHLAAQGRNAPIVSRFLDVPGIKFNIRNHGGRTAFDLCPKSFLKPFRPRMDQIIAEARANVQAKKIAARRNYDQK